MSRWERRLWETASIWFPTQAMRGSKEPAAPKIFSIFSQLFSSGFLKVFSQMRDGFYLIPTQAMSKRETLWKKIFILSQVFHQVIQNCFFFQQMRILSPPFLVISFLPFSQRRQVVWKSSKYFLHFLKKQLIYIDGKTWIYFHISHW